MKVYPLAHIFYISCPSLIPGAYCFRRGRRLQNSPYFAYSRTREQSNKRSGTRLKTESERLARFALKTLTPRFTDFFTDFEKKKPTVLQSTGKNIFLTFSRRKTYNTVKRTCLKHQYYAVKSQHHLVQSPISGS